jgi:uncharacterized protein with ParB-like and HNH nuclease domain
LVNLLKKTERSNYTTLDFVDWNEAGTLVLTPKFQRRGVWSEGARSFFIDTLIRGMPVPPIFLRTRQSDDKKKIVREVVDGQQRLTAVLTYKKDGFKLKKSLHKNWAGKRFSELDDEYRDAIDQFSFNCEMFSGVSDQDILAVFARLNTYSVPLNAQELRNGKYFGYFKQSAYRLAYEYVEFWRKHKVFSDRAVARMQEAELTSELLIAELDGLQDKKKSIDKFYQANEDSFNEQKKFESRFRSTMDALETALGEDLDDTEFTRPPLFYSLFCVVYQRLYGLPKSDLSTAKGHTLVANEGYALRDALTKLSEVIASARENEDFPSKYGKFVSACLRSTDNIESRTTRLKVIYQEAF